MKIAEYFEQVKQQHADQASARKERLRKIGEEVAATNAQLQGIKKERKKMQNLLADPPAQAFDTAKANEAIAGWDAQVAECEEKTRTLTAEKESLESEAADEAPSRCELFSNLLANVEECEEAQDVRVLDDCWPHCIVTIGDLDDTGRPQSCRISLGGDEARTLKIAGNEKRFAKAFRPPGLDWLPTQQDTSEEEHNNGSSRDRRMSVFMDAGRKLILSRTKLKWRTKVPPSYSYGQREEQYQNHEDDFSDIACSLAVRFDEIVGVENDVLDLTKDYSGNVLMAYLQGIVLSRTTSEPEFEPTDEEIVSTEIEKRIKAQWEAFVTCPWSGAIQGTLALLKYSVENRERVRFWSGDFKNHYGFRLRTRDHDWIVGEIYVTTLPMSPPERLQVRRDYGDAVATIGVLALRCTQD